MPKHKHNANEGERCTYNTKTNKKRPLLLSITTAFILLSPTGASVALASSFYDTERSPLGLSQSKPTTNQLRVLPKSYRDLLSLPKATPSLVDINDIESNIATAQKQLNTLKSILPKDPAQQASLDQAIQAAQLRLDTLSTKLAKAKADYSSYLAAQSTLQTALTKYTEATQKQNNLLLALSQATSDYDTALAALNAQIALTNTAKVNLEVAQSNLQEAENTYRTLSEKVQAQELFTANAKLELDAAGTSFSTSQQELDSAINANNQAQANLSSTQSDYDFSRAKYDQTVATYTQLLDTYTTVYNEYLDAQSTVNNTRTNLQDATNQLNQAQWNYDNNLIPDPSWTPETYQQEHIRLVPHTELVPVTTTTLTGGLTADVFNRQGYNNAPPLPSPTEQPIYTTTVPDINFNWGSGQVLNSGRSEDVIVRFTGNISFPTSGNYQFYSPADDGTILLIDGVQIISDWRDKGGGGSTSPAVYFEAGSTHTITLYYYENGGGANVWLYYYTPQTGYQIVPAAYLGTTATTTTSYVEVTTWDYETYYTTEIVPNQVHPLIHDPALLPDLQNAQIYFDATVLANQQAEEDWQIAQANQQVAASNATAGYYNVIDDAQVVNALYPQLQEAQAAATSASQLLTNKEQETVIAREALNTAKQAYSDAAGQLSTNKSEVEEAQQKMNTASETANSTKATKEQADLNLTTAQLNEQNTSTSKTIAQQNYDTATQEVASSTQEKTKAETTLEAATETVSTSYQELSSEQQPDLSPIQQIIDTEPPAPEPEPKPEEGSAEIPAVIEDLMQVDLAAVDPTELTEAQAEQLVEAALVVFETAEEGSAEYEQALDALYLAAEQDDIVVDEALANIPGVGQAAVAIANVLNLVGNVGADISPKARKKAQTLVVTTLVVGQIAQTAALATASAGSSSNRTIRKK